jgi:hypothetical protein
MSHLRSGGDSFRPGGSIHFDNAATRGLPDELEQMARDLGVDPDDAAPVKYARPGSQTDRSSTVEAIFDLIAEAAEDSSAPASAHELRRQLRAIGIDLGHAADDDQDRRSTARHEAAHAAIAHALNWTVTSIDIGAGETKIEWPDIMSRKLSDRNFQYAMIGAAGSAGAGTGSWSDENESDRIAVRLKGWTDFATARAKAEKLLADPDVKATHKRLTDALVMVGRLEGDALRRVLEDG